MSAPELHTHAVTVTERPDGWWLDWGLGSGGELHDSAVEARAAVEAFGRLMADAGVSSAIIIEWAPTTRVGRMVVRFLAEHL